ncbi:MAG: 16S rRNA (guanine(527)-N(7))-methyltransferase RsmG [Candidatus Sumerlaeaceae bacterium]|nr:16S rRNA (guanine(527)-N(7))-methyltransferase RsmG [Candidatus Sumerlaeaceae bacterium]
MKAGVTSFDAIVLRAIPEIARLGDAAVAMLARFAGLLLAANERTNLTTITDPQRMAVAHFADSLAALDAAPAQLAAARRAADVGCGAGFPLIPLAVAFPGCEWTGIESVGKKASFIAQVSQELGLTNVTTLAMRAEDAGRDPAWRGMFDLVTARAVGSTASLLEVGLPLLRDGGLLLLWKTAADASPLETVAGLLGGRVEPPYAYRFAGDRQDRLILRVRKMAETPATYPRRAGVPFKRPLRA